MAPVCEATAPSQVEAKSSPNASTWTRLWRWLPALLAIPVAVVYVLYVLAPATGTVHDDGIYLATAKSLAEGKGYRIQSLPSELPQTKYPILFPALLAVIWKTTGAGVAVPWIFKLIPVICVLGVAVALWNSGPRFGLSAVGARWAALAWAASPVVITHGTLALPDTLFALCCLGAILLLERAGQADGRGIRDSIFAGALTAASLLIRSIGVTLVPLVAYLCWRRKWRQAAAFLITAGVLVTPWVVHQSGQPFSTDFVERYYTKLSYAEGNLLALRNLSEMGQVLFYNAAHQLVSLGAMMGLGPDPCGYLMGFLLALLALAGLCRGAVQGARLHAAWTILYLGALCVWVWPPYRYLIPVLPLLLLFAASPIEQMIRARRAPAFFTCVLLGVSTIMTSWTDLRLGKETRQNGWPSAGPGMVESWTDHQAAFAWIRKHTSPDDIVGANLDPMVFLNTGRKSIRLTNYNQFDLFYSTDPKIKPLGDSEQFRQHLLRHRIAYVLLTPMPAFRESAALRINLAELLQRYPGALQPVPGFSRPGYAIYQVRWDLL